jgi:mannosylfructose-phosphate synthase
MMISTHGYVAALPEAGKPDTGGQVVFVLRLSECLARMGYKIDILTRQFEDQAPLEYLNEDVRILRFPCGGNEFIPKETLCDFIPEWVQNAEEFIEKENYSFEFINSHYWDAGLAGELLAERFAIPHLHTPHSIGAWKRKNMDGDPDDLERKYNFERRIHDENTIYHNCRLLVATTEEQRDILRSIDYEVPDERIIVIPPGYDDMRFFPVSEATRQSIRQNLSIEGPLVLALGRMAHNKGYDLLIHAMTVVLQREPAARLLLAIGSTDPSPREMEQITELKHLAQELGMSEQVIFADFIPDELLADYYRVADVFALSSRYEPFGMTAVEAMACGTPTVITTQGGLKGSVKWGLDAVYADPFNTEGFGHAIAAVLKFPEVACQMSRHAAETARAKFTWNGVAQKLLASLDVPPGHGIPWSREAAVI